MIQLSQIGLLGSRFIEQSTAPSPLVANAFSTTQIDLWWIGAAADSYTLQRATLADYSDAVQIYLGTAKTFTDTGRTANTTYYYRVKSAKSGFASSSWVTFSCKTLSVVPLHAYDFRGIPYNATNIYGATGAPATAKQVREIYSYRGTANTLTPSSATYGTLQENETIQSINKYSAYTRVSNGALYTPATAIDLTTGDFTILIEMSKNNLTGILQNFMSNNADTLIFLSMSVGGYRFRFGHTAYTFTPLWPVSLGSYNVQRLIIKLSGDSLFGGIMADDGSVSFGAAITGVIRLSGVMDRLFNPGAQWQLSILNFYSQALTDAQIQEEFKRAEQPAYFFAALNKSLAPKVSTWSDLSSGYFINPDTGYSATSGASWAGIYTIGGYTNVRLLKKDSLVQDFLKMYRHSDAKISNDILMGMPGSVADGHNIGSIFPLDNTYYHFEQDIHYDKTVPTNLVIKRFGKDYDMTEYTQLPSGNGIPSYRASMGQYPQIIKTANYLHVIVQEWDGDSPPWITDYRFKDNCNSCEKIRLANTGGANWFYFTLIHSEDNIIRVCLHYLLIGATDRYPFSAYIESSDDFNTVHNLMYGFNSGGAGAFTKSISNNEAALTLSELQTNCLMTHDGTADSNDNRVTSAYFDPTDGKVYACAVNGSNTGLNFIHSVNGVFVEVAINLLGRNIISSYGEAGAIGHGTNVPTIVRTGTNSYTLMCQEVVSGSIWRVVKFTTTDAWATSSFVGNITNDDTKTHDRIMVTRNVHHTGGVSAYSEKRLLACSRELTVPDSHSDTFFYDMSI